jgi:N-acetylglucosaminyl-diphospho-decaprenol L-rhamnosyltransferase
LLINANKFKKMLISVILVSYNTAKMSIESLNSLFASVGDFELEVFVIDNASKDDSVALISKQYPNVTLIENKENVGFGRANNQALSLIKGDYVLLLNTDAFVKTDTLQKSIAYMQTNTRCGVLGARLIGQNGDLQPSCRYFPTPFNLFAERVGLSKLFPKIKLVDDVNFNADLTQSCDWVPGCYYMVRRSVIDDVGLFDPLYFLYSEEVDHCFAVKKAGWDVVYLADIEVVHIGGESAKSVGKISMVSRQVPQLQIESELLYFRKNHGVLGVLTHILLSNLTDILQAIKDIIRLKGLHKIAYSIKRIFTFWQTLFVTDFATRSTR